MQKNYNKNVIRCVSREITYASAYLLPTFQRYSKLSVTTKKFHYTTFGGIYNSNIFIRAKLLRSIRVKENTGIEVNNLNFKLAILSLL